MKLNRLLKQILREYDKYPCGITLAGHLSPRITELDKKFDGVYAELKKLDEELGYAQYRPK